MTNAWERLKPLLAELNDMGSAIRLMSWDQAVMLPAKGSPGRARVMATMQGFAHEKLTSPVIGEILDELGATDDLDEIQRASVRNLKRDYDKATKVPADLVRELAETEGLAYQAWTEARPANDFSKLQPYLEKVLELKKQEADALGWENERYDALIDLFEPDMSAAEAEALFKDLIAGLKPFAEEVLSKVGDRPEFLGRGFDTEKQMEFSQWLVGVLGFDTTAGRLDVSPHPFTSAVGKGDVRQTTRTLPNEVMGSIYATAHETGHALYEQGIPEELLDLPVGSFPSLGLHESQSRLWENQVGRSRQFTTFMLPHLKERFPEELNDVDEDLFYRGVNDVRRTLIRVHADEVTYNLHLALRLELELALFRDELEIADLPDAWDDAMERHVGIRPPTASDGVMQDMHWAIGALGYFPTYTIGTLYAAAFFAKAQEELSGLEDEIGRGETSRLLDWLRENIHHRAYIYPAKELAQKVLGAELTPQPFLDYLRDKYTAIYG
jgi:carboxypeptidase Taq